MSAAEQRVVLDKLPGRVPGAPHNRNDHFGDGT
jgi:hypothetical protein